MPLFFFFFFCENSFRKQNFLQTNLILSQIYSQIILEDLKFLYCGEVCNLKVC